MKLRKLISASWKHSKLKFKRLATWFREKQQIDDFSQVLPKLDRAFSNTGNNRRIYVNALLLFIFFTLGGFAFDLLNPELGLSIQWFNHARGSDITLPQSFEFEAIYFAISNTAASLSAVFSLLIFRQPLWRAPIAGFFIGIVGYIHSIMGFVGIINVVWHGVLGAILFVVILANGMVFDIGSPIATSANAIHKSSGEVNIKVVDRRLSGISDELWDLLKLLGQMVLSFSAITGVCMTILFRDGYEVINIKLMGIQMASGFFLSCAALYLWIAAPCLNLLSMTRVVSLQAYSKSLDSKSNPNNNLQINHMNQTGEQ